MFRWRNPQNVEQRGSQIGQRNDFAYTRSRLTFSRAGENEWNVQCRIVDQHSMLGFHVLIETFAMIAGDHNQRCRVELAVF